MHTSARSATARDPMRTASTPNVPRRAYQRLRMHRRMLPLLAALTLLTGLLVSGAAYLELRSGASSPAQTTAANELALVLLLITFLMTLLALLCGALLSGAPSSATLAKLDLRLNEVANHAADLEQVVRAQVGRSQRQARLAHQVSECTRELNTLMEVVEQGQAALQESAGEIWAGMSQPGQMLDSARANRLARQSAVVAGRIGSATEDARERFRYLIGMMNHVIAEGRVLGDEGRRLEERANALRLAIERVEMALGAKVVDRQYDLPGHPFARRLRHASRQPDGAPHEAAVQPPAVHPQTGHLPALAGERFARITTPPGSSTNQPTNGANHMWLSGQWPAASPSPLPPLPSLPTSWASSRPLSSSHPLGSNSAPGAGAGDARRSMPSQVPDFTIPPSVDSSARDSRGLGPLSGPVSPPGGSPRPGLPRAGISGQHLIPPDSPFSMPWTTAQGAIPGESSQRATDPWRLPTPPASWQPPLPPVTPGWPRENPLPPPPLDGTRQPPPELQPPAWLND